MDNFSFKRNVSNVNYLFNPLSARAFFWAFLEKYRKFDFVTQFLRNGSTKIQGFVEFCRKCQALLRKCQIFFIIFTVSGVTAVRSDHGVMSYIPDIGS